MKYVLTSLVFLSTIFIYAKTYPSNTYIVVSDEKSKDVAEGTCLVFGNIYEGPTALQNGLISNIDRSRSCVSNEKGEYSLVLSKLDSSIFFFKEGFDEQVIWSYEFKSGHAVRIDFYAGFNVEILTVDKPVIYLYAEEDLELSIYPEFKGDLSFTYPEMDEQWEISLIDNQIVDKKTAKKYPYLFWEGEIDNLDFVKKNDRLNGSLLAKDDVLDYLESSLSEMGLNQKEKTDFITFWFPKMTEKEFVFVQFLLNETVDNQIGKLKVKPKPNNSQRVYMLFETYEKAPIIDAEAQQFTTSKRDGFFLLEWGGTQIKSSKISL